MSPGDAGRFDDNVRWWVEYRVSAVEYAAESSVDIDVPISNDDVPVKKRMADIINLWCIVRMLIIL